MGDPLVKRFATLLVAVSLASLMPNQPSEAVDQPTTDLWVNTCSGQTESQKYSYRPENSVAVPAIPGWNYYS